MWEELYKAHYAELLHYCIGACRDNGLAEDLTQETFLKALQNGDTFADLGPSQRRAWLYRTVKHLICDHYRRKALQERYSEEPEESTVQEEGYQLAENAQVLAALPVQDRVLFQLRYLEGYDASELAEMFDMPAGTVRAKLSRGRKRLKALLFEK